MSKLAPVLLVDDDKDDRDLIREALQDAGLKNPVYLFEEAEGLYNYLSDNPKPSLSSCTAELDPALILLDLNMPKINGQQLLESLRAEERFDLTNIIVLTTSGNPRDREAALLAGAAGYYVKPASYTELTEVMRTIIATRLPPETGRKAGGGC